MKTRIIPILFFIFISEKSFPQSEWQVNGDVQMDAQYYLEDSLIGAKKVNEKILSNNYFNLYLSRGSLNMGIRYENFSNPMLGFDPRLKGSGFPYKFIEYKFPTLTITAGNFYEQFGLGLTLRSYEERSLGFDNALEGIRIQSQPWKGFYLKALIGQERLFFSKAEGILRGADFEINLNEVFDSLKQKPFQFTFGGSVVSRYQADKDPIYKLPENVLAWALRYNLGYKNLRWNNEFAYKYNDPNATNGYIYKDGNALISVITYTRKGLGILLGAKRADNMDFRADRTLTGLAGMINYVPAMAKIHAYSLSALYPYVAQPNGEMAFQGQISYNIPKKTRLGGKYGMDINIQYDLSHAIEKKPISDTIPIGQKGTDGYISPFFGIGKERYFEDATIEIFKKISPKLKGMLSYVYLVYNSLAFEGHDYGTFYNHIGILDLTWKITSKHALRFEAQYLYKKQYDKNWASLLAEYSFSKGWFFSLGDIYNYNNPDPTHRNHYYTVNLTRTFNSTRISITYGKIQEGISCVGGVCRYVPASYGFSLSINTSF